MEPSKLKMSPMPSRVSALSKNSEALNVVLLIKGEKIAVKKLAMQAQITAIEILAYLILA